MIETKEQLFGIIDLKVEGLRNKAIIKDAIEDYTDAMNEVKSESISDVIERYSLPKNLDRSIARFVELGVKIKKEGLEPDEYEEYEDLCDMVKSDFL